MADSILELIEQMRNPGESGIPDTIYDDLSSMYTTELDGKDTEMSAAAAHVAELEAALQGRDGEISRLKSLLYDQALNEPGDPDDDSDDGADNGADDNDADFGIDALFTKKGN